MATLPARQRFNDEISGSHQVVSKLFVIGPTGIVGELELTDGQVNVDRSAQYRRAATFTVYDPLGVFMPDNNTGILTPTGSEIQPFRGVQYEDGTQELYRLGVFHLSKVTIAETAGSSPSDPTTAGVSYTLEMYDRSYKISRDQFQVPYTVNVGVNVVDAIQQIISRTFPNLNYDAISTATTISSPKVYDASNDPWSAATDLATSIGCEVYFNVDGDVVIAPPPDITSLTAPVFTYIEGEGCTMTSLQTIYDDSPGYNGVIVTGASLGNTDPPVRAVAWDSDPTSPTYYLGPYGAVPMFIQDQNVTTTDQAQAEANSLLNSQLGQSTSLTITASVNPTYEGGDVVQAQRNLMNVSGLYIIDAFVVPMQAAEAQTLTLRQKGSLSTSTHAAPQIPSATISTSGP